MKAGELELVLSTAMGVATYPPGATYGPRVMRDYEFVWIIEGDAEYRWSGTTVAAPAGSIVLCRPTAGLAPADDTDLFRWDTARRTRHAFFHFNLSRLPPDWPPLHAWPLVRETVDDDILRPMFRHVLSWSAKPGADGAGLQDALRRLSVLHMLACFVTGRIATGDIPRESLPEPVERATRYVVRRLDEEPSARIGLDELADAASVTREHLCRLFKSSTGYSPVQTVRLARLDRAAVLLARSNYSVAEVATMCGFASPFHFSRRFKDAFGQAPTSLRQSIAGGATPPVPRLTRFLGR